MINMLNSSKIKTSKIKIMVALMLCIVCLPFMACNFNCSAVNAEITKKDFIPDGSYIVLSVRESIGGNNVREMYILDIVLQDENNERYYYEFESYDEKSDEYIDLAKLIPLDNVIYQSGYIFRTEN